MSFEKQYLKYKNKYLTLKQKLFINKQIGGADVAAHALIDNRVNNAIRDAIRDARIVANAGLIVRDVPYGAVGAPGPGPGPGADARYIRAWLAGIVNIPIPAQIGAILDRNIDQVEADRVTAGLPAFTPTERAVEEQRLRDIGIFQDHITCSICMANVKNIVICTRGHKLCASCTLDIIRTQDTEARNAWPPRPPVHIIKCPLCNTDSPLNNLIQTRQKYRFGMKRERQGLYR